MVLMPARKGFQGTGIDLSQLCVYPEARASIPLVWTLTGSHYLFTRVGLSLEVSDRQLHTWSRSSLSETSLAH